MDFAQNIYVNIRNTQLNIRNILSKLIFVEGVSIRKVRLKLLSMQILPNKLTFSFPLCLFLETSMNTSDRSSSKGYVFVLDATCWCLLIESDNFLSLSHNNVCSITRHKNYDSFQSP